MENPVRTALPLHGLREQCQDPLVEIVGFLIKREEYLYHHKVVNSSSLNAGDSRDPWVGKIPWRGRWQPTPVFLPGESHGQRSLVGYSPQGPKTEGLSIHPQAFKQRLQEHLPEMW